jgi:hypothetical protein
MCFLSITYMDTLRKPCLIQTMESGLDTFIRQSSAFVVALFPPEMEFTIWIIVACGCLSSQAV